MVIQEEIVELHMRIQASLLVIGITLASVSVWAFGCERTGFGVQNGRDMATESMCFMVISVLVPFLGGLG